MRFDKNVLLASDQRALYSDSLRPPVGHVFDGGLATTFSLDLEALLTIPVYLALASVPDARDALANPIAVLEAIERTSRKLAIFVQGGHMHAVEKQSRLCALLEAVTVEVNAPRGRQARKERGATTVRAASLKILETVRQNRTRLGARIECRHVKKTF